MKLYEYREVVLIQTGWNNPVEGPDTLPEGYREIILIRTGWGNPVGGPRNSQRVIEKSS
jgi:hypothetical protein